MFQKLVYFCFLIALSRSQEADNLCDLFNLQSPSTGDAALLDLINQGTVKEDFNNPCSPIQKHLPPGVPKNNMCPDGKCVPYYLCAKNSLNSEGLFEISFKEDEPKRCHDYFETCCAAEDQLEALKTQAVNKKVGCGNRNKNGSLFDFKNMDNEAHYGEFPWMIMILNEDTVRSQTQDIYLCGGSLIHPKVILTTAHCVRRKNAQKLKVRASEWDYQTKNEIHPHQDRIVTDILVHPEYNHGSLYNDIALLFINQSVEINEIVQTVCLPPQGYTFDNTQCVVSAWGEDALTPEEKYQVILKSTELPVVPFKQCENKLRTTRLTSRFNLHSSFICAGGESKTTACRGAGGSPLVCPIQNETDRYYQSGMAAWGIGCGENGIPGVYVSVSYFRNWIDQQFLQRNLDTGYYNP